MQILLFVLQPALFAAVAKGVIVVAVLRLVNHAYAIATFSL